jgi:hypothetical protein
MGDRTVAVVSAELTNTSQRLTTIAMTYENETAPEYGRDAVSVGHVELAEAICQYNGHLGAAVVSLRENLSSFGERLDRTVWDYETTEESIFTDIQALDVPDFGVVIKK